MIERINVFSSPLEATDAELGSLTTELGVLPLRKVEVQATISGINVCTKVTQQFVNVFPIPMEAKYIFPLPDRSAVREFGMRVGDRRVEGVLKARDKAREEYGQAVERGHQACLVEQYQSGVFALRVGNLPPGEVAIVELTIDGTLAMCDTHAEYRFPLVVAPRYEEAGLPTKALRECGFPSGVGDAVATSLDSPTYYSGGSHSSVDLSFRVKLMTLPGEADAFLRQIHCSLHDVQVDSMDPVELSLKQKERLNRDFLLRFPLNGGQLNAWFETCPANQQGPGVMSLTVLPPEIPSNQMPVPRDVVFVLDRSGSMGGWKLHAARRALGRILDTLLDQDRFSILAFDDRIALFTHQLVSGSDRQRWRAIEWLGKVNDRGGTELGAALLKAVEILPATNLHRQQMIVLVTDGQISDEAPVYAQLQATGRPLTIHAVGIDRAVNAGFLHGLVHRFSGQCELVESEGRLDEAMHRLHRILNAPVLTDVTIQAVDFEIVEESLTPSTRRDVYLGRPLQFMARHSKSDASMTVRLRGIDSNGQLFEREFCSDGLCSDRDRLLAVWGKARISELEQRCTSTEQERIHVDQCIMATSLESKTLSRTTAFVAIDSDRQIVRNQGWVQVLQPVEIPDAWGAPKSFVATSPSMRYEVEPCLPGTNASSFPRLRNVRTFVSPSLFRAGYTLKVGGGLWRALRRVLERALAVASDVIRIRMRKKNWKAQLFKKRQSSLECVEELPLPNAVCRELEEAIQTHGDDLQAVLRDRHVRLKISREASSSKGYVIELESPSTRP